MIQEIYHGTYHLGIVGAVLEAARFDLVLEHGHIPNPELTLSFVQQLPQPHPNAAHRDARSNLSSDNLIVKPPVSTSNWMYRQILQRWRCTCRDNNAAASLYLKVRPFAFFVR